MSKKIIVLIAGALAPLFDAAWQHLVIVGGGPAGLGEDQKLVVGPHDHARAAVLVAEQPPALGEAGVVLVEALFYAAALRGRWRWSLALSIAANAAVLGAGMLFASGALRPG